MGRADDPSINLKPEDVTLVSVLGAVHDSCISLTEIVAMAKEMAPDVWQPTGQLVGDCVVTALNTGLLRLITPPRLDGVAYFEITENGRHVLQCLLRRAVPTHCDGLTHTCVAAKLCFLDCMDPTDRFIQVDELAHAYRDRLAALRQRVEDRSATRRQSRRWLYHEIERFEWELAWLNHLRSHMEPGQVLNDYPEDSISCGSRGASR